MPRATTAAPSALCARSRTVCDAASGIVGTRTSFRHAPRLSASMRSGCAKRSPARTANSGTH
eukprot:742869-Pyramimonas_sp.AAC.1